MMEHQKILNNDDIQNKWKICIKAYCVVYRLTEMCRSACDTIQKALKSVVDTVTTVWKAFSDLFSSLWDSLLLHIKHLKQPLRKKISRPPKYTNFVRVNTKGFTRPIMKCARSRC